MFRDISSGSPELEKVEFPVKGASAEFERNEEICRMFADGKTLQAIGDKYGVSRERIRQIVKRTGKLKSRSEQKADTYAPILVEMKKGEKTAEDISAEFGLHLLVIKSLANRNGIDLPKPKRHYDDYIATLVERVRNGESILSASGGDAQTRYRITAACKKAGVKSKKLARWRDFSDRKRIIVEGRQNGRTWAAIARDVSTAEECGVSGQSVKVWAERQGLLA